VSDGDRGRTDGGRGRCLIEIAVGNGLQTVPDGNIRLRRNVCYNVQTFAVTS
jgi:hypothetical protein